MTHYNNTAEVETVVKGFESLATPKDAFTHREHLTVAMYYVLLFDDDEALKRMREGLRRFLDHHAVDPNKYNETITLFWLKLVRNFADDLDKNCSLTEATNALLDHFRNSRLIFDYYSDGVLQTSEAKEGWVEPDLKSLNS